MGGTKWGMRLAAILGMFGGDVARASNWLTQRDNADWIASGQRAHRHTKGKRSRR